MVPSRLIVSTEGKNYLRIRRRKEQAKTFGEFFIAVVYFISIIPLISSLKESYDAFFFFNHYFVYLVYKNMLACFNI